MLEWHELEIAARLDAGRGLKEIEDEVIEPANELSDDERAALWLFAWSYRESRSRLALAGQI